MDVRVLIVEDDNITAHIVETTLKKSKSIFNFVTRRVSNLDDAIKTIKKGAFDVVLLDLFLPPHNCSDTFEAIKKYHWNDLAVVVIMTGLVFEPVKKEMEKLGLKFLIPKEDLMSDIRGMGLILVQAINTSIVKSTMSEVVKLRRQMA